MPITGTYNGPSPSSTCAKWGPPQCSEGLVKWTDNQCYNEMKDTTHLYPQAPYYQCETPIPPIGADMGLEKKAIVGTPPSTVQSTQWPFLCNPVAPAFQVQPGQPSFMFGTTKYACTPNIPNKPQL